MKILLVAGLALSLLAILTVNINTTTQIIEADQLDSKFMSYLMDFRKSYGNYEEYLTRFENFKWTLKIINEHNSKPGITSIQGLNQFSDFHYHEFSSLLTFRPNNFLRKEKTLEAKVGEEFEPVDWRKNYAVNKI